MIKSLIANKLFLLITTVVLGGTAYFYFSGEEGPSADTIIAERRTITQEVSVTGTVKSVREANLAFEKSGRVSRVYVEVGDRVSAGQILIALDAAELSAQLQEAKATASVQRAKLDELQRGTRLEEINIAEAKVANAVTAIGDAKKNAVDTLRDSYTKSDDAVRNKTDQLFDNPRSMYPELKFQPGDVALGTKVEQDRPLMEGILQKWKTRVDQLSVNTNLNQEISAANTDLDYINLFLNTIALIVNNLNANVNLSQATIDKYRADISTARTNVNTAISNLSTSQEKLRSAESSLSIAQKELDLQKAGATLEQVAAQAAQLAQAEARVRVIEAQVETALLRAPFMGVVAKSNVKVGEIVTVQSPVISLISYNEFEIEAHVPEADIAKLDLGDGAAVTLDAYGNDIEFSATVQSIDPAETIIEGVSTYKVILELSEENGRIKSGMTANIDILTDRKENVIAVPVRAVLNRNGDRVVRVLVGNEIQDKKVVTGIRGSDGSIEIQSGIQEGEQVVVFLREE